MGSIHAKFVHLVWGVASVLGLRSHSCIRGRNLGQQAKTFFSPLKRPIIFPGLNQNYDRMMKGGIKTSFKLSLCAPVSVLAMFCVLRIVSCILNDQTAESGWPFCLYPLRPHFAHFSINSKRPISHSLCISTQQSPLLFAFHFFSKLQFCEKVW